jgi:hypothetical protein
MTITTARELTARLSDLLHREHSAMADFLVALADFDERRLWEPLGHASLFAFLRRELRLSAGAAQYRKTAAELVRKYPEVEAALRGGRLCLSSVIELAKVVTPDNASDVLPRFYGLSSRDAAFIAASIRPVENPPVREFIVTPVRADVSPEPEPTIGPPPSANGAASAAPLFRAPEIDVPARVSAPSAAAVARTAPAAAATTVEPLDGERARIHMTVSRRLLAKLDAARYALSHSHPGASRDEIVEVGLDLLLERHAKRRGLVEKPRKARPQAPAPERPAASVAALAPALQHAAGGLNDRYVPAEIRRAVWKRDGGRCQWPTHDGGVCGSTHQVELDHVLAFAKGGRITSVEDGRLLCRPHNDRHARQVFGDEWMNQFTRGRAPPSS